MTIPTDRRKRRRIAAIDVGTNSIRLVVAELGGDSGYRVIDDEKVIARLGHGLDETGRLSEDAMVRAAEAVARMHEIAKGYDVADVRAIATCAVREATNGADLATMIHEQADIPLEIISAEEEARLAHNSVAHAFDLRHTHAAIADIGGGSTEVIVSAAGVIENVHPLRLGAVRLTERYGTCEDGTGEQAEAIRTAIRQHLRERMPRPDTPIQTLYGSGGTFTTLASMLLHENAPKTASDLLPFSVAGFEAQRDEVRHLLGRLSEMTVRERARVPGLSADRADIIVAGLLIVDELMRRFRVNRVRIHDRGIRDGLLLEMMGNRRTTPEERLNRVASAERFASACRYEEKHCQHVASLALAIFDDLVFELDAGEAPWASGDCRELLHAASLLHDVGYLINYSKHHKHSYHLIAHSDMSGFSTREREIVANVARYHRRSTPAKKHPNFAKLSEEDQAIVRRLSAILRLADGLDRSHTQSVRSVTTRVRDGAVVLHVAAEDEPKVDIWGAERKSTMFEEVFDMRLQIVFQTDAPKPTVRVTPAATLGAERAST